MADDHRSEELPAGAPSATGGADDVPPEQRGAATREQEPEPEPVGDRSGGAGSGTAGGVLESPGGPGTVTQEPEEEKTLAQELVEEEAPSEISPDMGTAKADPGAGGARFDELVAKRRKDGLSDQEADELGRLMAEREGREWTSTRSLREGFPADSA
jgi:hypothetical protein